MTLAELVHFWPVPIIGAILLVGIWLSFNLGRH